MRRAHAIACASGRGDGTLSSGDGRAAPPSLATGWTAYVAHALRSVARAFVAGAIDETSSGSLLNLAATDTPRAHHDSPDTAANCRTNLLKIWIPSPLGLVVRVAHAVADRRSFSANCTMSHAVKPWLPCEAAQSVISKARARIVNLARCAPGLKRASLQGRILGC